MNEHMNQDIQDQEFERYGVWIKAGPEEVLEADDDFAMVDLEEDAVEDLSLTALTAPDDEDDLVSLDDLDIEEPLEDADPFDVLVGDEESGDTDGEDVDEDGFNLESLNQSLDDDFESLDLDERDLESLEDSMPGSDDEIEEISLEDIEDTQTSETLPELEADLEQEHDFALETLEDEFSETITPDEEEFLREEDYSPVEESADLQNNAESAIPSTMDFQEREAFDRIQTELGDIKRELAELKEVLRGTVAVPRQIPSPQDDDHGGPGQEFDEASDAALAPGTGFFEDEEDETIALTGDELDNILNTAEFTEEVGEAEELDDDFLLLNEETAQIEDDADLDDADLEIEDADLEMEMDEDSPSEPAPFVLDGDDAAVDELADMDIDRELADIESLHDETEADTGEELDEIELDLDALDEIEPSEEDEFGDSSGEQDELEEDEFELELGEMELDEPPLDKSSDSDSAVDKIELDELESEELASPDLVLDEIESDEIESDEIELDEPVDTVPTEDEELELELGEIDDLELTSDDILEADNIATETAAEDEDDEGFEDFATAVEQDLDTSAEPMTIQDDEIISGEAPEEALEEESLQDESLNFDLEMETEEADEPPLPAPPTQRTTIADLPEDLKQEIRSVLSYMDQLLEALPDDKIEEFAQSEHFEVYKHLFEELGLET